jgi:hypothetical protein
MWLSADPAMGEYIPQAPVNDEAKKHNQNLPGMGGVFNYVNLHAYHYAGNNPVVLKDPDGRNSGIAIDDEGAKGAGHVAGFVNIGDDKWAVFELTGITNDTEVPNRNEIPEDATVGQTYKDANGYDVLVLSNKPNIFPSAKNSKSKWDNAPNAAVLVRFFDSTEKRDEFFRRAGYDRLIEFKTTAEQDANVLKNVNMLAKRMGGYFLPTNNCGSFLQESFFYGDTGVNTGTGVINIPKIFFLGMKFSNAFNVKQRSLR